MATMMSSPRIALTGINEGIEVHVKTTTKGAESPLKIQEAIKYIFPDAKNLEIGEPTFGEKNNNILEWEGVSMETFLKKIHEQRILDTALDMMVREIDGNSTTFEISRQSASVGKISFPIPNEYPFGGVIEISLSGDHLIDWIQSATWHSGRERFPRFAGDDFEMYNDGESKVWHDSREVSR